MKPDRHDLPKRSVRLVAALLTSTVLLAGAFAADAHAASSKTLLARQPLPTPSQVLAVALPIAEAAWPGSPCTGQAIVKTPAHLYETTNYDDALESVSSGTEISGLFTGGCNVELSLSANRDPAQFCDTLTHELGHADGQPHATTGIMMPSGGAYGPCHHDPQLLAWERVLAAHDVPICRRVGDRTSCMTLGASVAHDARKAKSRKPAASHH